LIGYVGTEAIGTDDTRAWLERFSSANRELSLSDFCPALAARLSTEWASLELGSCLWVFVAGYEAADSRFWFVVNAELDETRGVYVDVSSQFRAVNDLDEHAIPRYLPRGGTKEDVLSRRIVFFRNGALVPAAGICDHYTKLLEWLLFGSHPGFGPVTTIDEYAYLVKQRQEFTKRLFSKKHGVYKGAASPIGGEIFIRSVAAGGEIHAYGKHKGQLTQLS
jgi:hypothetical protein